MGGASKVRRRVKKEGEDKGGSPGEPSNKGRTREGCPKGCRQGFAAGFVARFVARFAGLGKPRRSPQVRPRGQPHLKNDTSPERFERAGAGVKAVTQRKSEIVANVTLDRPRWFAAGLFAGASEHGREREQARRSGHLISHMASQGRSLTHHQAPASSGA